MQHLAKIYGIIVIFLLIDIGISNSDNVIFKLWPFDFAISINFGLLMVVLFLFAFFAGGLFLWMNNFAILRKKVKTSKKQIKTLEAKINDIEKRTEV